MGTAEYRHPESCNVISSLGECLANFLEIQEGRIEAANCIRPPQEESSKVTFVLRGSSLLKLRRRKYHGKKIAMKQSFWEPLSEQVSSISVLIQPEAM